ncbi:MAG TPA: GerMN domain-containing protein [Acidimicrobiales bacterium]
MTSGRWNVAPPRRRRSLAALPALAFAAVGLAACGPSAPSAPVAVGPPAAPGSTTAGSLGATAPGAVPPAGAAGTPAGGAPVTGPTTELPIYFVRDGKLGVARRQLPADVDIVNNALDALLAGPSTAETEAGLSTSIPNLTRVRGTGLMGDVLVVNLSGSFSALGPQFSSELRVAQIVYTVSVFPVRVLFQIDGQAARAIGGFILPDRPVTRDDFASWAPPVLVETIGPNERLTPTTPISGSTAAAGTGVGIRVTDAAGRVVYEGSTLSAKGRGVRHAFETAAPFTAAPGPGTLTVSELNPAPFTQPLVLTIPVQLG